MNICVIGGSGFIGGYLIEILKRDHKVFNLDKTPGKKHQDVTYINCDIRDYTALSKSLSSKFDYIILLAAEHRDDVSPTSLYYDVNVKGTQNVLQVMTEKNINNILFTSSVSVYGLNKNMPNEFSDTDPFNHYGKSKLQAEEVLKKWYQVDQFKKSLVIIRPTVVFGPGNRGNVYNLLKQISSGKFMMVGNGNNRKSMAYVENIAAIIDHCVNSGYENFQIFNYIDKPDLTTKELVKHAELAIHKKIAPVKIPYYAGYSIALVLDFLFGLAKKKNPISAVRIKKFCSTTQFDSATIHASGFKAPVSLEKGLEVTIKSILSDKNSEVKPVLSPVLQPNS